MSDLARPGTSFYAPQARLVDASSGEVLEQANPDLVSVRITQVHHGVSQLSLTLNNQRDLPRNPVFPPWQYNDLDTFRFGKRLRVDVRYGGQKGGWVPMILARITDLQFSFPASGAALLTVQGEDLLSLLKLSDREKKDKRYQGQQEVDIVGDCLRRAGADLTLGGPLVPRLTFSQPLANEVHQKSQTFLQFVQQLAERIDYELFVEFDDPFTVVAETGGPPPPVKLHFEPARSLTLKDVVDLSWGKNLLELTPRFSVWDQYTSVTVKGQDPRRRAPIEKEATAAAVEEDLQREGGPAPENAVAARQRFFADEQPENPFAASVTNLDEARAEANAKRLLREKARQLLTAEGSTIGLPRLRPGVHLNLGGLRPPFDGHYYVTRATHTLDASGYKTSFSIRRPGLLPPDLYLESAEVA